jgi:hypothetical protein
MTTSTFYASTADGIIISTDTVYATSRAGSGLSANDAAVANQVGQDLVAADYLCKQLFISFDTSSIPDTDFITSATLAMWLTADNSTTDFTLDARIHNWGATLTTADFVAGADLAAKTLVGTLASSGIGATGAYKDFTNVALPANVSKTGTTYIMLASRNQSDSVAPTGQERLSFSMADETGTTQDPKLTIVHAPLTINQVTETDLAQPMRRNPLPFGQVTETDLAQPMTGRKTYAMGQPSETDLAQAFTRVKSWTLGQPSEIDLAQAFIWTLTAIPNPMFISEMNLQAAKHELALESNTVAHHAITAKNELALESNTVAHHTIAYPQR